MKHDEHRVSIGLPPYDGGERLEGAMASRLAQTDRSISPWTPDNASTDETESVCRRFAARDDRILFAELALLGRIRQVAKPLYRRLRHASQSTSADPSPRDRSRWIDPTRRRRLAGSHLGDFAGIASAARRAASDLSSRMRCAHRMARWTWWHHGELLDDLLGRDTYQRRKAAR